MSLSDKYFIIAVVYFATAPLHPSTGAKLGYVAAAIAALFAVMFSASEL